MFMDTMSDLAVTYSVIKESKSSHSSIIIMFAVIEQNDLTFSNSHFAADPKPINNPVKKSFILIRIFSKRKFGKKILFSFCQNDNCEINLWVKNKNSRMREVLKRFTSQKCSLRMQYMTG